MDAILLESPIQNDPPGSFFFPSDRSYESMLKESIDRFLIEVHNHPQDFSVFRSVFCRLLQSNLDPPLEVIWFYSAANYFDAVHARKDALDRVLGIRDLVQLLIACSAACDWRKSIALLAPVVSEIYHCLVEEKELSGKAKREAEGLVEGIISYISICCSKSCSDGSCGLLSCFMDLVRVWSLRNSASGNGLQVLFPLVNDEVRVELVERCPYVGYLAGVVIAEVFLLRLCLKARGASEVKTELPKELKVWAVSSVTVFRSCVFFEILLKLLLSPMLPVKSLLDVKDENFVRNILYDAVILVDYSFLNAGLEPENYSDWMRNLALTRLIISHEAVRIAKAKGEQSKAISYLSAFSTSSLPKELVKWVKSHPGMERYTGPNAMTPQALLEWLMGLEEYGLKLFEDNISRLRTKLMFDDSKALHEESMADPNSKMSDAELFFFDSKGDATKESAKDEEMESVDTMFYDAARSMKSSENNIMRKRKECGGEGAMPVKIFKYKIPDDSLKDYFRSSAVDGMSSGSEIENPLSDDDMEAVEK